MLQKFCDKNANKKKLLDELINKQLKNISVERKLHNRDLRRIIKYIDSSIFDEENCCMWNGYVTNETNLKRGTYVNFFFRNKKVALHRLLYDNFVGHLGDEYYLKFSCDENSTDGKCCNINHMIKYKYNNCQKETDNIVIENKEETNNNICDAMIPNTPIKKNIDTKAKKNKNEKKFFSENLTLAFD